MAEKDINLYAPNSWLEEESKVKQKAVKLPSHLRIYNQTPITDEITQKMLTPKQMFLDVDAKKIATTQYNPKKTPKGYYSELVLEIEEPETIVALYKEKALRNRKYRKDLVTEGKRDFDFFKNSALVCQSTSKLFDFIMIKISETGVFLWDDNEFEEKAPSFFDKALKFSIDEYIDLLGKKDRKTVRETIKLDLEILKRQRFYCTTFTPNKEPQTWTSISLFGGTLEIPARGRYINLKINSDFIRVMRYYKYQTGLFYQFFDIEALRGNENKNPMYYAMFKKLLSHRRINIKREKNQQMKISVKALAEYCKQHLPTYEEVKAHGNKVSQRILEPFERDLKAIENTGSLTYKFVNKDNVEKIPTTYQEWIESDLLITWNYAYPNVKQLQEGIKKNSKKSTKKDTKENQ